MAHHLLLRRQAKTALEYPSFRDSLHYHITTRNRSASLCASVLFSSTATLDLRPSIALPFLIYRGVVYESASWRPRRRPTDLTQTPFRDRWFRPLYQRRAGAEPDRPALYRRAACRALVHPDLGWPRRCLISTRAHHGRAGRALPFRWWRHRVHRSWPRPAVGWLTGALYLAAIAVGGPPTALVFAEYVGKLFSLPATRNFACRGGHAGRCSSSPISSTCRRSCACSAGSSSAASPPSPSRWLLALPHVTMARLTDASGYDLTGVAATGLICFFAFVGWENAAFSGEEFADPRTLSSRWGWPSPPSARSSSAGHRGGRRTEPVSYCDERHLAGRPGTSLAGRGSDERIAAVIALVTLFILSCSPGHAARRD